jgi:hypothetical protein|tara:strand:+ start:518 stop:1309 length:792 start_codon:yes stop_codon:yes gene_type:complete
MKLDTEFTREEKHTAAFQKIWHKDGEGSTAELNDIFDWLDTFRQGLWDDMVAGLDGTPHEQIQQVLDRDESYKAVLDQRNYTITDTQRLVAENEHGLDSWMANNLRYGLDNRPGHWDKDRPLHYDFTKDNPLKIPTATTVLDRFSYEECPIASYSILRANSVIKRHTGIENRKGQYMRIHVPLYVPEGELYFEVCNQETDWTKTFGFNNQWIHSAYNESSEHRAVFSVDLHRNLLDVPTGVHYFNSKFKEMNEFDTDPYIRTQ